MKEKIYYEEDGKPYVLDEKGNKRPPMQLKETTFTISGFQIFDSSQGHCALCGSLTCCGTCFK